LLVSPWFLYEDKDKTMGADGCMICRDMVIACWAICKIKPSMVVYSLIRNLSYCLQKLSNKVKNKKTRLRIVPLEHNIIKR
jgi:hypothetical protein